MEIQYDYNKQVMKKEIYGEGKRIEFEGNKLIAPDKVEEYLTQLYGNYMELPPEDARKKAYEGLELSLDDATKEKYAN